MSTWRSWDICGNRMGRSNTANIKIPHWVPFWTSSIYLPSPKPTYLRGRSIFNIILSSLLSSTWPFLKTFLKQNCVCIPCYISSPSCPPKLHRHNNICGMYKPMRSSLFNNSILNCSRTTSTSGSNIFPCFMFSNTFQFKLHGCSSGKVCRNKCCFDLW